MREEFCGRRVRSESGRVPSNGIGSNGDDGLAEVPEKTETRRSNLLFIYGEGHRWNYLSLAGHRIV